MRPEFKFNLKTNDPLVVKIKAFAESFAKIQPNLPQQTGISRTARPALVVKRSVKSLDAMLQQLVIAHIHHYVQKAEDAIVKIEIDQFQGNAREKATFLAQKNELIAQIKKDLVVKFKQDYEDLLGSDRSYLGEFFKIFYLEKMTLGRNESWDFYSMSLDPTTRFSSVLPAKVVDQGPWGSGPWSSEEDSEDDEKNSADHKVDISVSSSGQTLCPFKEKVDILGIFAEPRGQIRVVLNQFTLNLLTDNFTHTHAQIYDSKGFLSATKLDLMQGIKRLGQGDAFFAEPNLNRFQRGLGVSFSPLFKFGKIEQLEPGHFLMQGAVLTLNELESGLKRRELHVHTPQFIWRPNFVGIVNWNCLKFFNFPHGKSRLISTGKKILLKQPVSCLSRVNDSQFAIAYKQGKDEKAGVKVDILDEKFCGTSFELNIGVGRNIYEMIALKKAPFLILGVEKIDDKGEVLERDCLIVLNWETGLYFTRQLNPSLIENPFAVLENDTVACSTRTELCLSLEIIDPVIVYKRIEAAIHKSYLSKIVYKNRTSRDITDLIAGFVGENEKLGSLYSDLRRGVVLDLKPIKIGLANITRSIQLEVKHKPLIDPSRINSSINMDQPVPINYLDSVNTCFANAYPYGTPSIKILGGVLAIAAAGCLSYMSGFAAANMSLNSDLLPLPQIPPWNSTINKFLGENYPLNSAGNVVNLAAVLFLSYSTIKQVVSIFKSIAKANPQADQGTHQPQSQVQQIAQGTNQLQSQVQQIVAEPYKIAVMMTGAGLLVFAKDKISAEASYTIGFFAGVGFLLFQNFKSQSTLANYGNMMFNSNSITDYLPILSNPQTNLVNQPGLQAAPQLGNT